MKDSQSSKWFPLADKEYTLCQQKFMEMLHGQKLSRYLDIGCHDGSFTLKCAAAFAAEKVCGIEIDSKVADIACSKGVEVTVTDASYRFPYPDSSFDVITANQVLEHVPDVDNLLHECYRVLDDEGIILVSSPNLCSLFQRLLILSGSQPTTLHVSKIQVGNFLRGTETKNEHIHAFAATALIDLLKYHEFDEIKLKGSGFYPLPPPFSSWISAIFPRLAIYSIVMARKTAKKSRPGC